MRHELFDVMTAERPEFQCVLIAWGDKYGPRDINRIVEGVRRNSRVPVRFVLISDRPRDGLDPAVRIVDYPKWWLAPEFRKGGCQAKLAMFERGVLPDDLPALFLDLDTAILGDLARLTSLMRQPRDIWMLQSVVLPFGWPGRLVYRLTASPSCTMAELGSPSSRRRPSVRSTCSSCITSLMTRSTPVQPVLTL